MFDHGHDRLIDQDVSKSRFWRRNAHEAILKPVFMKLRHIVSLLTKSSIIRHIPETAINIISREASKGKFCDGRGTEIEIAICSFELFDTHQSNISSLHDCPDSRDF
jgi:hypothetical protein